MTAPGPSLDPRVRRTRAALQAALACLLESKDFEAISVQDIAEQAGLNRATVYDHYPDKFALLEAMVGARFDELLSERGAVFDGTCTSALRAIVHGVCDYLAARPRNDCERQRQMEPHFESAVIAVVRERLLAGVRAHPPATATSPEIIATTSSWAIYGAAKEWLQTPNRTSSEAMADVILALIAPIVTPTPATAASA
jgi:AcrR family transcriptional regulator